MAKDKKSFLLYCDLLEVAKELDDKSRGELFLYILEYVNDLNPEPPSQLIKMLFIPIKQALKRDLIKYENICDRNKTNGSKGGRPKKPKKPSGLLGNPEKPKKPDIDNDTVIDTDNDILKMETEWRNQFLKHYSINLKEYNKRLDIFSLAYDMTRPEKELKQHFFNWFKLQDYTKHVEPTRHWNEDLVIDTGKKPRQ